MALLFRVMLLLVCFSMHSSALADEYFIDAKYTSIDLKKYFRDLNGCAVFYTPSTQSIEIYNEKMSKLQAPPQSTFKIISTLMGLEYGIIENAESKMHYNGTKYWFEKWNKDLNLQEAFTYSCVWYYHQLVYAIPRKNVENFLNKLHYGNEDVSMWHGNAKNSIKELNGFWLSSSLKISPLEQVFLLANIFELKTFLNKEHVAIVKKIMRQPNNIFYAKTGSNMKGKSWFVGFIDESNSRKYFAFYVDDSKGGVSEAKAIASQVLKINNIAK